MAAITPDTDTQDVETDALPTVTQVTDTHLGTVGQRLHRASITLTGAALDTLATGDHVVLRVARVSADAADTMTGDCDSADRRPSPRNPMAVRFHGGDDNYTPPPGCTGNVLHGHLLGVPCFPTYERPTRGIIHCHLDSTASYLAGRPNVDGAPRTYMGGA
jgi:hypothetical protein